MDMIVMESASQPLFELVERSGEECQRVIHCSILLLLKESSLPQQLSPEKTR